MKKPKKNFAQKAYTGTEVSAEMTQVNIVKMLEALGISETRVTSAGNQYTVEFVAKLQHDESPRKVRINVPLDTVGDEEMSEEHKKDVVFRVFYWHLKNRFVAINRGLKEFESEFLDDIVIVYQGKEVRIGDIRVPEIKRQLKGSDKVLLSIHGR